MGDPCAATCGALAAEPGTALGCFAPLAAGPFFGVVSAGGIARILDVAGNGPMLVLATAGDNLIRPGPGKWQLDE